MMKKNRHLTLKSVMLLILAMFAFSAAQAQEDVEIKEDKTIKIKMVKNEDGDISIDTTIVIKGDFDGDWKALIDDEDLAKKLQEIDIEIESYGDHENVIIMSPGKSKQAYMYVIAEEGEDGEVKIEISEGDKDVQNVWVSKAEGDSTITYIIKSDAEGKEGEKKVMVWHSDDGETHDILLEKMDGEDGKVMIVTVDDDGEAKSTVVKKEVIIIKDGKIQDCDHDKDKDKKKKKK